MRLSTIGWSILICIHNFISILSLQVFEQLWKFWIIINLSLTLLSVDQIINITTGGKTGPVLPRNTSYWEKLSSLKCLKCCMRIHMINTGIMLFVYNFMSSHICVLVVGRGWRKCRGPMVAWCNWKCTGWEKYFRTYGFKAVGGTANISLVG